MELHERIKKIRLDNKLTQNEFATRLGVTRSVISNIELNRLAKPEQKTSLIKLISKEFSINEEWLLYGSGKIENESEIFSLDEYAKANGATEFEINILKNYFEMPLEARQQFLQVFKSIFPSDNDISATKEETFEEKKKRELEAYSKELDAEQKGIISSVSEKPKGKGA